MSNHASSLSWRKRLLFAGLFSLIVGLSLEILLQLLCFFSPPVARILTPSRQVAAVQDESPTVSDEILGHRPRPNYADHDSRGFRNPYPIDQADIVCLGDSQTYGQGVSRSEAWPFRLEGPSDAKVYSMAYGGWGPTHSEALLAEVKSLRPKMVIEGFYAGNDLYDAYEMVYSRSQSDNHRSSDAAVSEAIIKANERELLSEKIGILFRNYIGDFENKNEHKSTESTKEAMPQPSALRSLLSDHSRVYGLVRAVRNWKRTKDDPSSLNQESWKKLRDKATFSQGKWEIFDSQSVRTILTPEYRLAGLQMDDPRIKEGHRICMSALSNMSRDLSEHQIEFTIVLIPTKELVFAAQAKHPSPKYAQLLSNETQMWEATKEFLDMQNISFIDTLPALRSATENGVQTYPMSTDGHPNAAGHQVIARAVSDWLTRTDKNE